MLLEIPSLPEASLEFSLKEAYPSAKNSSCFILPRPKDPAVGGSVFRAQKDQRLLGSFSGLGCNAVFPSPADRLAGSSK